MSAALPQHPLLAFYGDDFTGSTDAMEVLAAHRLPTLLFLRQPTETEITVASKRFAAIGIAGISRAQSPTWMDEHLPAVYAALQQVGASVCHYKVCSTFDSSPTTGNIGRALTLGRTAFDAQIATPVVVGAPQMRRYTCFGHLFASSGADGDVVRIDRHPTMSAHPATPMNESDLRLHLSSQAALRIGLLDTAAQQSGGNDSDQQLNELLENHDAVLFDVMDSHSQARTGELIWLLAEKHRIQQIQLQGQLQTQPTSPLFCVGSSGIQYALVAHWAKLWPELVEQQYLSAESVDRIAVVSGSCSPVTAEQITTALTDGFADVRVDTVALLNELTRDAERARLKRVAISALDKGMSPLIYSACGPDDTEITRLLAFIDEHRLHKSATLELLGSLLGEVLHDLIQEHGVKRIVVAGGDTSGAVVHALGLAALQMYARLFPGAPLCQAYTCLDGEASLEPAIEIALKGGQMGKADYFSAARRGHA